LWREAMQALTEQVTIQDFKDWKQAVRCRKVEAKFEELALEAIKNGITVDQQMEKSGYKNLTQFLLSCPKFSKYCWPSELAELGSGYVMYFHFLAFVGCFLFACFLIQLPAVMDYYDADNIGDWGSTVLKHDPERNESGKSPTLGSGYGTPGNLGPRKGDNEMIPLYYFAMVCFLFAAIVAKSGWQLWVDLKVDQGTTHPNDFAVLVEDLPRSATDETQIMDWFKEHAVAGQKDTEIVKVVIGWDAKEFRQKTKRILELKKLIAADPTGPDADKYMHEIKTINSELMSTAPDVAAKLASSGVAVVIFRKQTDHRRCLERWGSVWAQYAYREAGGMGGLLGGGSLPRFPIGTPPRPVYKIKVKRAPNPGDINWVDLGVSKAEKRRKLAESNGIMLLIVLVSFGICYLMNWIKHSVTNVWLSLLPAFGIAFANVGLQTAAKKFGEREYHNTLAGQTSSQSLKMTVGMIVNTAGVIFATSPLAWMWFASAGLVNDIIMLIALTAVIQPLMQGLDIKYYINNKIKGGAVNEKNIAAWNNVADQLKKTIDSGVKPPPDLIAAAKKCKAQKDSIKKAIVPSEIDMYRRYAYVVRTFVCVMFYAPLVPILTLVGIIGVAVQYWVDKSLVANWAMRPQYPVGPTQAKEALLFMRASSLLMPISMWIFLHPCYKKTDGIVTYMALSYVPAFFLCIVPLSLLRRFFCAPCRNRYKNRKVADEDHQEDYYAAQHMWPKDMKYHKSHFLYKCLPESKNPENFTPGTSAAMKAEDLKKGFEDDPSAAADAAGKDDGFHMKGHKVHGAIGGSEDVGYGAGMAGGGGGAKYGAVAAAPAPAPAPAAVTPIGAAPAGDAGVTPVTVVTPVVVTPAVTPVVMPAGDAGKGDDDAGKSGPTWEYENHKDDWRKFDDDCHDYIEKQYQEYKRNGDKDKRAKVRTKGITLSLDFERMTQMVEHGHGTKDIRRRD